jgi:DNA-3-methyladenine glycosylase
MPQLLTPSYFAQPTLELAPRLLGAVVSVGECAGRIVEIEAYTDDPASHGHRRTARSNIMHDTYGMVYVYFIYGRYHCLNFTTDRHDTGAVLIRALEPLRGIARMQRRRGVSDVRVLCNGPGKLCAALGIDASFNWTPVGGRVVISAGRAGLVQRSPRIGITKARELHWRFYEEGSEFVSRGPRQDR